MARKPESTFKNAIHRYLSSTVYRASIGGVYANGWPDEYYEGRKGILFVEYKYVVCSSKNVIPVNLSELQKQWLKRAYDNHVNVAVIVGMEKQGVILTAPKVWEREVLHEEFRVQSLSYKQLADWIFNEVQPFYMR